MDKTVGKKAAIITGRTSSIVERRVQDLNIEYLYQGIHNKEEVLASILAKEKLSWSQVAVIGDDLNDYKMLKKAGLSFAPANASRYIKNMVNVVCSKNGGEGAVREMLEYIFKEYNLEEEFINAWV